MPDLPEVSVRYWSGQETVRGSFFGEARGGVVCVCCAR
ncbi:hypothetical protein PC119_g25375 [Phytophthora cactorum]|nr:hypothetical protein PC119_g25375 [Phytophthora cactorum]